MRAKARQTHRGTAPAHLTNIGQELAPGLPSVPQCARRNKPTRKATGPRSCRSAPARRSTPGRHAAPWMEVQRQRHRAARASLRWLCRRPVRSASPGAKPLACGQSQPTQAGRMRAAHCAKSGAAESGTKGTLAQRDKTVGSKLPSDRATRMINPPRGGSSSRLSSALAASRFMSSAPSMIDDAPGRKT